MRRAVVAPMSYFSTTPSVSTGLPSTNSTATSMESDPPGIGMGSTTRSITLRPDGVSTAMSRYVTGTPSARQKKIIAGTPMGRYGELKELIGAMLFLVDERAAGFVTGVVLPVDGGYSAYSGV